MKEGPPPYSIDDEAMRFYLLATLFEGLICLERLTNCAEFVVDIAAVAWWTPLPRAAFWEAMNLLSERTSVLGMPLALLFCSWRISGLGLSQMFV